MGRLILLLLLLLLLLLFQSHVFKLKSLFILLEPKIVSHFHYFRGTILVDLDVPLSFPDFILSLFCDKLICKDYNCTLLHVYIVNFL